VYTHRNGSGISALITKTKERREWECEKEYEKSENDHDEDDAFEFEQETCRDGSWRRRRRSDEWC